MIFDSHAHYNDSKFNEDRDKVLKDLENSNVKYIMNVADSMKSLEKVIKIADEYPFVFASVGVHPEETGELTEADIDTLLEYTKHPKVKAIGEIGLDYYWDSVERDLQKKWFCRQIDLAKQVNLPIIVHDRDAHGDTIDILKSARDVKGIVHCFSGSQEMAREVLNLGMYVGIGGTVTFKNARKIKEVAEYVPLESIVLETDAPYLAPEPFRGKRNSSDLIKYVIEEISKIKGISQEEVEEITFKNAKRIYKIED